MRTINVCHISTMTRWGGVERMLADLLLNAAQTEVRHMLLTTSSNPEIVSEIKSAGLTVFQPQRRFRYDPTAILQMANWLRQQRVDIVHTYNTVANTWGGLAAQFANIPFVAGEHGTTWSAKFPMSWLENLALKRAKIVVTNSKASAKMVQLKRGVPAAKTQVVYNAVPPLPVADRQAIRREFGFTPNQLIVGSIGRLDTPKHFSLFVEVAALILKRRDDVRFLLVGGGPLEAVLRRQVAELGITDKFILTGWREDARAILQIFELFVSTSIRESFGNVIVEAGLAAIPVIAPAVDGIPEVVVDGQTGILLQPTDHISFVSDSGASPIPKRVLINGEMLPPKALNQQNLLENILILLDNPRQRMLYGLAARSRAKELFTIERYITQLENIYVNILTEIR